MTKFSLHHWLRAALTRSAGAGVALSAVLAIAVAVPSVSETPRARSAAASTAAPTVFQVANFNVLGHSHTRPGGNRPGWASSNARMLWTTQLIAKYGVDLIGFQEFEPVQVDRFNSLMKTSWEVWPGRSIAAATSNSVAWRTSEWTAVVRRTYLAPYFEGKMRPRPLVQLRNNRTGQLVWLMNTHNPADTRGSAQRWRDQAERIQAALVNDLKRNSPTVPVLFTGDMNDRERFYCPVAYLSDLESASGGHHEDVPGGACEPTRPMRVDWIMGTSDISFSRYTDVQDALVKKTSDHPFLFATATVPAQETRAAGVKRVVVIDAQGLRSNVVAGGYTPHLSALMSSGASTLNARTDPSVRAALPNTISMLTSRFVSRSSGGHGVTSNRYRGTTVHGAAGRYVSSVFDTAHDLGLRTSLYSGDARSALVARTWDTSSAGADRYGANNGQPKISVRVIGSDDTATRSARSALTSRPAGLTVVQLNRALQAGTKQGWRSRGYLDEVAAMDRRVGAIVSTIKANPATATSTLVVVTTSTPGTPGSYGYGVPLVVWGPSVEQGDLYALNPAYRDPGSAREPSAGQPIRTGVVGNLVTSALTLPVIPGSQHNARQSLDVFGP